MNIAFRNVGIATTLFNLLIRNEDLNNLVNLTISCDRNRKKSSVDLGGGFGYFMCPKEFDSFLTFVQRGKTNLKYFKPMSNTYYCRLIREFYEMCERDRNDYISSDYFSSFLRRNECLFTDVTKELFNEAFGRIIFEFDNVIPFPIIIDKEMLNGDGEYTPRL